MWRHRNDKIAYKHTGRPPTHYPVSQTRLHAAPYSQFHHRCAVKSLHCYLLRHSGGARRPYSALHVRTCRGGKALHRACIALAARVVRQWVP
jgi:hypothetical protein